MKRAFDVIASVLGLVVVSVPLAIIALVVLFDSGAPVLFRQPRVGRGGRPFEILKFRTMVVAQGLGSSLTIGEDRRITRSGRILRTYKLDELPQLFNVLVGDMSLVGPRPEVPEYAFLYPEQQEVWSVRPGITDPAAVRFRNESGLLAGASDPDAYYRETILPDKIASYLDYVRHRTFFGDLRVIFDTLFRVAMRPEGDDGARPAGADPPEARVAEAPPSLAGRSAVAAAWTLGAQLFTEPVRLGYTAVLARVLSPREFGLVGMAAVFIGLAAIGNDLGLAAALINRKHLTPDQIDSVFWLNMVVGAAFAVLGWTCAPLVAGVYNVPQVAGLFRALSLSFVLTSLVLVQGALVRREMDFRTPAIASVVSVSVTALFAVGSALAGYGAYALAYGTIAGLVAFCIYVQVVTRYVPRLRFRWSDVKSYLSFGSMITVGELANYGVANVDNLAVGRMLGAVSLGLYGVAYNLVTYPVRRIARLLAQVLFPAMSSIRDDAVRFRRAYERALSAVLVVLWPLLAALAVCGNEVIVGLYGTKWIMAVEPFRVLCLGAMAMAVVAFCELALKSTGHATVYAIWAGLSLVGFSIVVFALAPAGTVAVAWGVTASTMLSAAAAQQCVDSFAGTTWRGLASCAAPSLVVAGTAALTAFCVVSVFRAAHVPLVVGGLASVSIAVAASWLALRWWPWFSALREVEDLVIGLLRRRASHA